MRIFTSKTAVCVLGTLVLSSGPSLALDSERARTEAIENLKSQLAAGTAVLTARPTAPEFGAALDLTAAAAGRNDPVSHRLDTVFDLVIPDNTLDAIATMARLPKPRPEPESGEVALAYAKTSGSTSRGLSAIEALVEQHAEANDVPPALALALVQVESSYNPKATGANGEIGLLQISPKTARAIGYKGSPKDLYDAETNLSWGMKYLGKAHKLADGDTCGTLVRYNAGLDAKPKKGASNKFCAKVKSVMAERA